MDEAAPETTFTGGVDLMANTGVVVAVAVVVATEVVSTSRKLIQSCSLDSRRPSWRTTGW